MEASGTVMLDVRSHPLKEISDTTLLDQICDRK